MVGEELKEGVMPNEFPITDISGVGGSGFYPPTSSYPMANSASSAVGAAASGSASGGLGGFVSALGPIAGFLGPIFGGLLGNKGQADANASNERIARENRAFQERMSSTAYQRAATDLQAAGLNRILALGSPASSPGGSTAVMQNAKAPLAQGISSATSSAINLKSQLAQIENIQSDSALKKATALKTAQEVQNLTTARELTIAQRDITRLQIPGVRSEAELWDWLQGAGAGEISKVFGKAAPIVTKFLPLLFGGKK